MTYNKLYFEIKNKYISFPIRMGGVLYEPVNGDERSSVGIVLMHSDDDYYGFVPAPELAKRGFTVLASKVGKSCETLDKKILDVKNAVEYLKNVPGIKKLVLLGHSGGATLMSA